jgi:imidazolonepropionase-like amidohydrolase
VFIERRRLACLALAAASCAVARPTSNGGAPAVVSPSAVAIAPVTVVDVASGSEVPDRAVVVDGDRIVAVVAASAAPAVRTIDGRGKYVIPGLWDMHVHFADPNAAMLFVANGVTGVRVMWGNPRAALGLDRFHFKMREAFDRKEVIGPRMIIASQILDGPRPIWRNSVALATPEQGRQAVDDAKTSGVDFIKVYSLLPREIFLAIADESRKQRLPFAGHVPEAVTVADASDAGQKSIEHLTGMPVSCSWREADLIRKVADFARKNASPSEWSRFRRDLRAEAMASYDPARARALFAKLVANGTWQTPTLTVLHSMATLDDPSRASDPRMQYVSPFWKTRWDPRADFRTSSWTAEDYAALRRHFDKAMAMVAEMNRAGVPLLAGTDEVNPYCFAGFSLHDELGFLVQAGLTPAQALRAATLGPARFLGTEASMGTVAPGHVADLVVLDADPLADIGNTRKISTVVSRGVVHDRAALDRMLEEVKAAAATPRSGAR